MLDRSSIIAQSFRMAREWCHSHGSQDFSLMLVSERTSAIQYNAPTVSEVAALIINDFGDGITLRDIIVNKNNTGPQRILELHPRYMALQYPLLFPYGEDGFGKKISYHSNTGSQKMKRGYVTMKEYYAYLIQHRHNQGTTFLLGERLFQKYLVDVVTAVEEQRLKWIRNNQDTLRVDLYHNLCDVVTRGDTSATCLGKRIVLPRSFIGSLRYMMQNYQDVMALCQAYGNPNLFITFTSNQRWAEISKMLAHVSGQKSHDRPEIGTRVFKMKLTELLDDFTKKHIFGDCCAEFQNRGLPHAHILLWLEERFKCTTPDEINDIISAELPYLAKDLDGYKVVFEYMLHEPCSKDAKYAPCTTEGKCSKHFPKVFLAETVIDEDGYPIYHRMDNKVTAIKGPNRATIVIQENVMAGADGALVQISQVDEIKNYLNLTLRDFENFSALLEREGINITMFTEWFELNKKDTYARQFTYAEIPQHYIRNYCLLEIQKLLNRHGRSLAEFQYLPHPNPRLLTNLDNRLIKEALNFDVNKNKVEHEQLHSLLNPEQRLIYDKVIEYVHSESSQFYFIHGPRGKGKTFVYRTIIATLRSVQMIVLVVASSAKKKEMEDEPTWIEILEELLIKLWSSPMEHIVFETYPYFTTTQTDKAYLKERAILTPGNDDADAINKYMFKKL
ncbi:helicase [Tanacetum coccineum]|uniref:ATP-dependent DNA helicase n=1 Tax=Tanacetum coccineum TaxID=301880 RepID=A0ABQ5A0T8_9ASTR